MVDLQQVQGSLRWHIERARRLTSSDLKANLTAKGALSESQVAQASIAKMLAGLEMGDVMMEDLSHYQAMEPWELSKFMADYTGDRFKGSVHTERGNKNEIAALQELSNLLGKGIDDGSMIVMGDMENGVVACSPDGQIQNDFGQMIEGTEVKCPCRCTYKVMIDKDILPTEYKLQVHASMAITGCKVWHFAAYSPSKPLFYKRVEWDDFTDTVKESLEGFSEQYAKQFHKDQANEEALRNRKLEGGSNE
jgi:hypothetical protein